MTSTRTPNTTLLTALLLSFMLCFINACSDKSDSSSTAASETSDAAKESVDTDITRWPQIIRKPDPELEERIDKLLMQMDLAQKVGQMMQAEIRTITPEKIKRLHLGALLNGGDNYVNGDRNASVDDWVDFMDIAYDASMDDSDGALAIPITYGIDAVHGNSKFGFATIFPHNIGLGATRNPELMRRIGEITALEVLATGIDWTFAPTLAVVRDDRWGRTYESYAETPELVKSFAAEIVEGIQGVEGEESFLDDQRVYATAKHWVGDGGTIDGVDQGFNEMDEQTLIALQASAYFPAIEAGVQSIMISHSYWQGDRMHGQKYLITDVLKNRLGFDGFIVGDWNAHGRVAGCSNDSCAKAVNAGLDMFMVTEDYEALIVNTIQQVKDGIIPMSRIDDAVRRILRVKIRSGLFDKGRPSSRPYARNRELMGSAEHRKVAAQAVRESLVLLKNNKQTLPLNPNQRILVTGDGANNIPKQTGAWTIGWQGQGNSNQDFPGATSIYDGIRDQVEAAGGVVELSEDASFSEKPDAAIVVFGENPYAEWQGDLQSIAYKPYASQDYELLKSLSSQGIPVVAVFISGRPLWVNRELNASDAFVAAWLPGSEGGAIADLLLTKADGTVNHDFKGKLSFSWPKLASQNSLNVGDADYDPLFPYGFGLSYNDKVELALLDEVNDYQPPADTASPYNIFTRGLAEDWQLFYDVSEAPVYLEKDMRIGSEHVVIQEADKLVQGDSFEAQVTGKAPTIVGISSPWYRVGSSSYLNQGGALSFDVRTITNPEGKVSAVMRCPSGYCGFYDITEALPSAESQAWATITIPLSCFAKHGVEFELNNLPFALQFEKAATLRVTNVLYSYEAVEQPSISCE